MDLLSRTASHESAASVSKSQTESLNGDMPDSALDTSGSSSPNNASKNPPSLASTGRAPSHSLLTAPQNLSGPSRKSRFADAGTVGGNVGRASISMPPPATKPSSIYKPANVRRPTGAQNPSDSKDGKASFDGTAEERLIGEGALPEELEKITSSHSVPTSEPHSPSAHSDSSLKPTSLTSNKAGDRLSFSSLYSLGSAIYNGTTGPTSAPPSAASSTAGSVKSVEQATPTTASMSPSLAPSKGKTASSATTATDLVSVVANSQASHEG